MRKRGARLRKDAGAGQDWVVSLRTMFAKPVREKTGASDRTHAETLLPGHYYLRFFAAFVFFFTVSAAGTVCSGNENNLTRESSSWILCIVCDILAMIRDFWSSVMSGCFASTCVEIKILRHVRAESSRRPPRHRRDACSMAWRCRFLTARRSQHGHVITEK